MLWGAPNWTPFTFSPTDVSTSKPLGREQDKNQQYVVMILPPVVQCFFLFSRYHSHELFFFLFLIFLASLDTNDHAVDIAQPYGLGKTIY